MTVYRTSGFEQPNDLESFVDIVARLEGCDLETARGFIASLQNELGNGFAEAFLLVSADSQSEPLGAVVLRPTPKGSLELFGGVPEHVDRATISEVLLRGAQALGGIQGVSTFASINYWDLATLERAGFREVAQYERFESHAPRLGMVNLPTGFTLSNFNANTDFEALLAGLRFYEDQWGHHHVNADAVRLGLEAYDPAHIWMLRDAEHTAAGLCRATLGSLSAWIDAPSVRPDLRGQGLHRALLTRTLEHFMLGGVSSFSLESWGEDPTNRADFLELGFRSVERTPLVVWRA
jgi:GNAT superfamily N-acetyltransferase